jgi:hypothetical protein
MAKISVLTVSGRPVAVVEPEEGAQMAEALATDMPTRKVGIIQIEPGKGFSALKRQLELNSKWLWEQAYTTCAFVTHIEFTAGAGEDEMIVTTYNRDGKVIDTDAMEKTEARKRYTYYMKYGFAATEDNQLLLLNMR